MTQIFAQSLNRNDSVLAAVERGKPAVFKVVDPERGWVSDLHAASPQTMLVGRIVKDHQGSLTDKDTATQAGLDWANRILDKAAEVEHIAWWEGSNEAATGLDKIQMLNYFESAFAGRIQSQGLHALVGGFATGTPEIAKDGEPFPWMGEWKQLYPAMEMADGFHFHEYWNPRKTSDLWNAYRYLMWYPFLPDHLKRKWVLISELGVDGGLCGEPGNGWQHYMSADDFQALLDPYNARLKDYPNIAATIFVAGDNVGNDWATFDIAGTSILDNLSGDWAVSNYQWGTDMSGQPSLDKLDRILERRCTAAGILYDNLVGLLATKPGTSLTNPRDFDILQGTTFHHTDTEPYTLTRDIWQNHYVRFGGMGYHVVSYCFRQGGTFWRKLRLVESPLEWRAHARHNNDRWLGYVWVGNYDQIAPDNDLMQAQAEMFRLWLDALTEWLGHIYGISSHKELVATQCPDGSLGWFRDDFVPMLAGSDPSEEYKQGWNDAIDAMIESGEMMRW